jgi:hypothetical protein
MTKRKNIIQTEEFWSALSKIAEHENWTMAKALFVAANAYFELNQERPGRGRPKSKPVARKRRRGKG